MDARHFEIKSSSGKVREALATTSLSILSSLDKNSINDRLILASHQRQSDEAFQLAKEYVQRVSDAKESKQDHATLNQIHELLKNLAHNKMKRALAYVLKQLPAKYLNLKPASALDYIYHAYPKKSEPSDQSDLRLELANTLLEKKANVSNRLMLMAQGEDDKAMLDLIKQHTPLHKDAKNNLANELSNIIADALQCSTEHHFRYYNFSNTLLALQRLFDLGMKPTTSSKPLEIALLRPDLPYAELLMNAGAPVSYTEFKFPNPRFTSQQAQKTAELFYKKCCDVLKHFGEHKLSPFFNEYYRLYRPTSTLSILFQAINGNEHLEASENTIARLNQAYHRTSAKHQLTLNAKLTTIEAAFRELKAALSRFGKHVTTKVARDLANKYLFGFQAREDDQGCFRDTSSRGYDVYDVDFFLTHALANFESKEMPNLQKKAEVKEEKAQKHR
jgi:hypothetical protein